MNHAAKRNSRDLICLSHLRWNFVFQRPQQLDDAMRERSPRLFLRRADFRRRPYPSCESRAIRACTFVNLIFRAIFLTRPVVDRASPSAVRAADEVED